MTKVEYVVNPPLFAIFEAKQRELMERHGQEGVRTILSFHGTSRQENLDSILTQVRAGHVSRVVCVCLAQVCRLKSDGLSRQALDKQRHQQQRELNEMSLAIQNFDMARIRRGRFGAGLYFSERSEVAAGYTTNALKKVLLCKLLIGCVPIYLWKAIEQQFTCLSSQS